MARIYRRKVIRYVDPTTGKRCSRTTPGAKRVRVKSKTWWGDYRDADGVVRREELCDDRHAALTRLAELVLQIESEGTLPDDGREPPQAERGDRHNDDVGLSDYAAREARLIELTCEIEIASISDAELHRRMTMLRNE